MTIVAIVLGLLPGFAWLFFYLQEDPHPEPKRLLARTFVFGAASAVFALILQLFLIKTGASVDVSAYAETNALDVRLIVSLLLLAVAEELFKFGAAYFAVHDDTDFNEPVDAMIYMVVAALGFATVENLGAVVTGQPAQTALVSSVFQTLSFRFVGATLLHTLTSALIGYAWAKSIRTFGARRFLVAGIALATVLHAVFNYLILNFGNVIFPVLFVIVVGFFALNDFEKLKRESV
jgi:RsiW-degrading membrane proteinase PrsW (M82 family)